MQDPTVMWFIFSDLLAIAFGAGGALFLLKQARKDVNGLGKKVRDELARSGVRHQNISLALMLLAGDGQKQEIAELLKESHEEVE
jgi:hypothetical protein